MNILFFISVTRAYGRGWPEDFVSRGTSFGRYETILYYIKYYLFHFII